MFGGVVCILNSTGTVPVPDAAVVSLETRAYIWYSSIVWQKLKHEMWIR